MKKKICYLILISILLIISLIFLFVKLNGKKGYYDITYISKDHDACLTFYNQKEYSLYDCDSEPTDYFFDSESECTYKYDGKYIKFKCKYNIQDTKTNKIKVLSWTKDKFEFIYNNKKITFNKKD